MKYNYKFFFKEHELFDFLKEYFVKDLEKSDDKMSRHDCISKAYNMDIELKCRRKHYDGLIIEKKKYDALMKRAENNGTFPTYINSTPEGVWAFYLKRYGDVEWEMKDLPRNTDFSKRSNIPKEIGYLDISKGVKLT